MATPHLVTLNVGGVHFVTRTSTLAASNSFFSGLVSTCHDAAEIFVDRDPTHFRYVLNWLRGVRVVPDDDMVLRELVWEADFYCLPDLKEALLNTRERFSIPRSVHVIAQRLRP